MPGACAKRIISTTADAHLMALDADTGRLCPDFGAGGYVDLRQGMGDVPPGFHFITSQPMVVRGIVEIGAFALLEIDDDPKTVEQDVLGDPIKDSGLRLGLDVIALADAALRCSAGRLREHGWHTHEQRVAARRRMVNATNEMWRNGSERVRRLRAFVRFMEKLIARRPTPVSWP